jgi:homoserine kinase
MPVGSGLGSSAASAVGGVYGLNLLLGSPYSKMDLLKFAIKGESIASGAIHADNVAPCLFGGFVLIRDYNPLEIIHLPVPKNLYCSVVYPHIIIETKKARKLIKKELPLPTARKHFGNIGALVSSLYSGNIDLLGRSIHDEISEPARATLIPGYEEIKNAAISNGAHGCSISGSGPSIFAFSKSRQSATKIANALKSVVLSKGIKANIYVSKINKEGPKVIDF